MCEAKESGNLVIERRLGEAVWIGNVRVKVIETGRHRAKLLITGPTSVNVRRDELDSDDNTETVSGGEP